MVELGHFYFGLTTPKFIVALPGLSGYNDQSRCCFSLSSTGHPEARRAEGSLEILPRFARQDEGANMEKHLAPAFNTDQQKGSKNDRRACHRQEF